MNTILLTGFKPFGKHLINDSETCVNMIKESGLDSELDVKLVTEVLDVNYYKAFDRIVQLWREVKPFLVVHLGVHRSDNIKIEKCARKSGYKLSDVRGSTPLFNVCPFGVEEVLYTKIDVSDISRSCSSGKYVIGQSMSAGRFLCEYVYYISLCHDPEKTVFIHVPPYKEGTSPDEKVAILKSVIKELYFKRLAMC